MTVVSYTSLGKRECGKVDMTKESVIQDNSDNLWQRRREKLEELRKSGCAYPNHFRRDSLAGDLLVDYAQQDADMLNDKSKHVTLAGRIMLKRDMGKVIFLDIQDMSGKMQIYVNKDNIIPAQFESVKQTDLGDIVGVEGLLFRTKTQQLSIKVEIFYLLCKSLCRVESPSLRKLRLIS